MITVSKQSENTPSMFDEQQNMDETMKSAQQFDGTGGSSGNVNEMLVNNSYKEDDDYEED